MQYYMYALTFISFLFIVQPSPLELIPVDAGIEDVGTLNASFKAQLQDFRIDNSFEKIYRVAGADGVYVRKSGALTAVFKNSSYIQSLGGEIPLIPAGTVYCIGEIPTSFIEQLVDLEQEQAPHPSRVEALSVEIKTGRLPFREQSVQTPREFAFIHNESYRRTRLASLVLKVVLSTP